MSILFRRRAQILVGVNGCYVTEFFSHFGCRMGIARTDIQCAICACKKRGHDFGPCEILLCICQSSYKVLACLGNMLGYTWNVPEEFTVLAHACLVGLCGKWVHSACNESARARCVAFWRGADGVHFVAALHAFSCSG